MIEALTRNWYVMEWSSRVMLPALTEPGNTCELHVDMQEMVGYCQGDHYVNILLSKGAHLIL